MDNPKEAFRVLDGNFDLWLQYKADFILNLCPTYAHIFLEPLWTNGKRQEEETKPVFPPRKNTANSALLDSKQQLLRTFLKFLSWVKTCNISVQSKNRKGTHMQKV